MAKEKKKKISGFKIFLILILILGIGGFVLGSNYYKSALGPMDPEDSELIDVSIPPATSTKSIAGILKEEEIIKDEIIFQYRVRSREVASRLKAGDYKFSKDMDLDGVIDRLVKGSKNLDTVRFTIPEGYEIVEIAEKLSGEGLIDKEAFLNLTGDKANFQEDFTFLKQLKDGQGLEGFLFPSTYEIYRDASEEEIISKMLEAFEDIYVEEIEPRMADFDLDLNGIITLASIVEREGKLDRERPIMSAVFHNRLEDGMMLQSCATVQYVLGERKPVLSTADTQIDSPFNTYINTGLPPAPIASTGRASLVAAVNPADVDYLFFVLTGDDGSHTFTNTYEEHLRVKP